LESDLLQFMELGPLPGTRLYREYEAAGKLIPGIPWPQQHGQDQIWFRHPHFTLSETADYLRDAFVKKYLAHGPGVLNMAMTAVKGYLRVKAEITEREKSGLTWDSKTLRYVAVTNPLPDAFMRQRLDSLKRNALRFRPALSSILKYAPNAQAAWKCRKVIDLYDEAFGPMTILDRMKSTAVRLLAIRGSSRMKKEGTVMRQPPTNRIVYPDRTLSPAKKACTAEIAPIAKQPEMEAATR